MSLINEALKQAGQPGVSSSPSPSPRAVGVLRPVSTPPASRPLLLVLLPIALLVALVMAFLVLKQAWSTRQETNVAPAATAPAKPADDWFQPVAPRSPESPAVAPQAVQATMSAPPLVDSKPSAPVTPGVASVSEAAPATSAASASAPAATPVPVALPAPPAFKLQGITYSAAAPSALVNGKAVFVGDEVDGALVTKIDRGSVTLAVEGKAQVLRMR
jgi:hypothetical protein